MNENEHELMMLMFARLFQAVKTLTEERKDLARFACNLHDGAVQSLIALEMQVDIVRRQAEANRPIGAELGRIQSLLREEVLKLRELMEHMKAIDEDAQRLLGRQQVRFVIADDHPIFRDGLRRLWRQKQISRL